MHLLQGSWKDTHHLKVIKALNQLNGIHVNPQFTWMISASKLNLAQIKSVIVTGMMTIEKYPIFITFLDDNKVY